MKFLICVVLSIELIVFSLAKADDECEPNGAPCNLDWTTDCCSGYCHGLYGWDRGYCATQKDSKSISTTQKPTSKLNKKTTPNSDQKNLSTVLGKFAHPNNRKSSNSVISEIPFQVTLSTNEEFPIAFCGAVLINKNTILSASHCVVDPNKENVPKNVSTVVARMGIERTGEPRTDLNTYRISKIYLHPNYENSDPFQRDDIAVIKLSKNVKFDSKIKPACLSFDDEIDDYLIGSGYGILEEVIYIDVDTNLPLKNYLNLRHRPLKYAYLKESNKSNECEPQLVCTTPYSSNSIRLVCFGSSGSPLMRSDKSVIGIKSVAPRPKGSLIACIGPERSTRLKYYREFIESKLDHKKDYCESFVECDD